MTGFLENLAAALLTLAEELAAAAFIFACICAAGCWWVTRDVGQAITLTVVDGRE